MARTVLLARLLLGIPFLLFGLNGFLHFMAPPGDLPAPAAEFLQALEQSRYLWPLKSSIEILAGVLLLADLFVPLALVLLAPILVNILGFHLFLDDPRNGALGYVLSVLALHLGHTHAPTFRALSVPRPTGGSTPKR